MANYKMSPKFLSTKRRRLLLGICGLVGTSMIPFGKVGYRKHQMHPLIAQESDIQAAGDSGLAERARNKGVIYGAATQQSFLADDPVFAEGFLRECRMIVPENDLKWDRIRPTPQDFDFSTTDTLINFAKNQNLLFRGHTLVWHHSLPDWYQEVVNAQNAEQYLIEHIQTVVGRYAGQIHSWDVVNEAIATYEGRSDGLGITPWLEFLGPDYIDLAFRIAAEVDPNALLVYNDFGLDYDVYEDDVKRHAVLNLLKRLKDKGTPVHALGIQGHLDGDETRFNPNKFRQFLSDVASLDLKILISELDVKDANLPADVDTRDRIVADAYENYLNVVLDEPAVIAVLTWGLSDRYTWLSEFEPRHDNLPVRPLPLDTSMNRKLAWNAIAHAFEQAPHR